MRRFSAVGCITNRALNLNERYNGHSWTFISPARYIYHLILMNLVGHFNSTSYFEAFGFVIVIVSEAEIFEDEKKPRRMGSLKKVAINASNKFRISLKKGKRSSKVASVEIEDVHDAEEAKAVDALRQRLILEELLPSKHDDYHIMLRLPSL